MRISDWSSDVCSSDLACAATTAGAQGPDRITRTGYDAVGRVETVTTGYGVDPIVATAATFTDNGRLATLTDGAGNRPTYEYDGYDRLVKARYPSKTVAGTSSQTDYEQFFLAYKVNITQRRPRVSVSSTARTHA